MQNEIINLYYFSLTETDKKYLTKINLILEHIQKYLQEEWVKMRQSKKDVGNYNMIEFNLWDIGKLLFFQKEKNIPKSLKYFPEMYSEIHIDTNYLENDEKLKKLIFLLSNIFECFDIFEEKYIFIEYHSAIEKLKTKYDIYNLRHNFQNINQLWKNYDFDKIRKHLYDFRLDPLASRDLETVKQYFPETYISLLLFCYLIFSLQKNKVSLENEIENLKNTDFSLHEWQVNQTLFILRAEEKMKQIDTTLKLYKQTFEKFLEIFL